MSSLPEWAWKDPSLLAPFHLPRRVAATLGAMPSARSEDGPTSSLRVSSYHHSEALSVRVRLRLTSSYCKRRRVLMWLLQVERGADDER